MPCCVLFFSDDHRGIALFPYHLRADKAGRFQHGDLVIDGTGRVIVIKLSFGNVLLTADSGILAVTEVFLLLGCYHIVAFDISATVFKGL